MSSRCFISENEILISNSGKSHFKRMVKAFPGKKVFRKSRTQRLIEADRKYWEGKK